MPVSVNVHAGVADVCTHYLAQGHDLSTRGVRNKTGPKVIVGDKSANFTVVGRCRRKSARPSSWCSLVPAVSIRWYLTPLTRPAVATDAGSDHSQSQPLLVRVEVREKRYVNNLERYGY